MQTVVPPLVPEGFRVFYTTIDFDGAIDDRIRAFLKPATLASCHQVHGVTVRHVGRAPHPAFGHPLPASRGEGSSREAQCDAMWTDAGNTALAIKVSDCLPVSVIDPPRGVIANIHSGWRGAVQNIVALTLDAAPLDPPASFAFLGPSIRVCCFEVGEEVASQFDSRFVDRTRGAKPHVDIPAFTTDVLRRRGFSAGNIIDTGLCTRCNAGQPSNSSTRQPVFHSYRRDPRSGRNLAIVAG